MTTNLERVQAALINYDAAQLRFAPTEAEFEPARGMQALMKAALISARAGLDAELRAKND